LVRPGTIGASFRKELTVFAVLSTFSLFSLLVCAGIVAPMLFTLLEHARQHADDLEHQLRDQEKVLRERDATIGAYREAMALQMNTLESLQLPLRDNPDGASLRIPGTFAST
jgi:hypothetical protein